LAARLAAGRPEGLKKTEERRIRAQELEREMEEAARPEEARRLQKEPIQTRELAPSRGLE
jgi:hypothetical protein